MGHRDLGDYFRSIGDYTNALKHHSKSREYCSTSQHVLDMCLSALEVCIAYRPSLKFDLKYLSLQLFIEYKNYSQISGYVFKADAALDAASASAAKAESSAAAALSTSAAAPKAGTVKRSAEREKVQAKLDFATAMSYLGLANYEKAAMGFLRLGAGDQLSDWMGKVRSDS